MAGQGWRMLVECLSVGRGITLPSNSTGGVKSVALATARMRTFAVSSKFLLVRWKGLKSRWRVLPVMPM